MVRWSDGLYGGLIAGVTSALFYAVVAVAWLHETTLGEFFARIAQALPPLHAASAAPPVVALGVVLHFLLAGGLGIVYGLLAIRLPSMRRAPASVLWGAGYGLVVWWLLDDVSSRSPAPRTSSRSGRACSARCSSTASCSPRRPRPWPGATRPARLDPCPAWWYAEG